MVPGVAVKELIWGGVAGGGVEEEPPPHAPNAKTKHEATIDPQRDGRHRLAVFMGKSLGQDTLSLVAPA